MRRAADLPGFLFVVCRWESRGFHDGVVRRGDPPECAAPRAHASKKLRIRGGLSRRVLIEGGENGKRAQTPKVLSAGQRQRRLLPEGTAVLPQEGARGGGFRVFPKGKKKIAGGGAQRHHRNQVPKTPHLAEGWQRIGSVPRHPQLSPIFSERTVISGTPPGCRPRRDTGSRGYRFAPPPATFCDAFGIRERVSFICFRCVSPGAAPIDPPRGACEKRS